MLFHVTYKEKAGITHEEQKESLKLWANFQPPEGYEIKSFYYGVNGKGFIVIEAASAEAIHEVNAIWSGVYIDYDVVPVIEVDKAVEIANKAIAKRESDDKPFSSKDSSMFVP